MEKLSKNFIWMAAANLVGGFFTILVYIYLARVLMPEAFGYLSYAQAVILYILTFVDLGLTTYGIREVAKDNARVSEYVSEIVSLKLIIASAIFIPFIFVVSMLNQSILLKMLTIEMYLLLFVLASATEWAFQGMERMRMVLVSFGVGTFLQLALIFLFVKGPQDLLRVPILQFIAALPVLVVFLKILGFRLRIRELNLNRIKIYLSSSIIIWGITMFVQVYNGLDIILLGFFRSIEEVGCFSIVRKVISGATLLMIFLINAALPRLSCTFTNDMAAFTAAIKKFFRLVLLLSIVISVTIFVFGKTLIYKIVGAGYLPAEAPLNIMTAGLVLVLFNLPFSTGLIAACHEKEVLKQSIASAGASVIANLILMPRYGMVGAAISFVLVEALALAWILVVYKKKMGYNHTANQEGG